MPAWLAPVDLVSGSQQPPCAPFLAAWAPNTWAAAGSGGAQEAPRLGTLALLPQWVSVAALSIRALFSEALSVEALPIVKALFAGAMPVEGRYAEGYPVAEHSSVPAAPLHGALVRARSTSEGCTTSEVGPTRALPGWTCRRRCRASMTRCACRGPPASAQHPPQNHCSDISRALPSGGSSTNSLHTHGT